MQFHRGTLQSVDCLFYDATLSSLQACHGDFASCIDRFPRSGVVRWASGSGARGIVFSAMVARLTAHGRLPVVASATFGQPKLRNMRYAPFREE